jgi:glycosyltransferase involved in cell wall biosynthesis
MTKITAIIPTLNEEIHIKDVIKSVDFADEILVVDSYSKDKTVEIAREMGARILQREYEYSASQKNWAIPQATNEWIILVDADERLTQELKDEIQLLLKGGDINDYSCYWINRNSHFMGKDIKYGGWNDKVIRLFKNSDCKYEDLKVHSEIVTTGKTGFLKNKLYHNTYRSFDHHMEKLNRYALLQAQDHDAKTGSLTGYHFVLKPMFRFFKHYIIQGGFRDGIVGLIISYTHSYSVFMRYVRLWLLRRNEK